MNKKEIFLILDAHALIHRAYHALPPSFITKKGELVNAVYGFASVLIKVLKEKKPTYVAAAFDQDKPTFRHKEFKEYKAHRPQTAFDLVNQIPKIRTLLGALGIPIIESPGFEADDVIGTLAKRFSNKANILILTGDLDTLQLVGDGVSVLTFKKGVSDSIIYDVDAVKARFDLEPSQLIDFKALKGDPSDNIPGVSGIGGKTATALIKQFLNIESLYTALEGEGSVDIKSGVKTKLITHKESAFVSKRLVTIRTDTPLTVQSIDEMKFSGIRQSPELESLFREWGFFSLFDRLLSEDMPRANITNSAPKNSQPAFEFSKKSISAQAVVVYYTNGQFFISQQEGESYVVEENKVQNTQFLFEDPAVKKIGYDIKSLWHALRSKNISLRGPLMDVMVGAYILYPGRRDYPLERIIFQEVGVALHHTTAGEQHCDYLWHICHKQQEKLIQNELEKVFYEIEMPLIPILGNMEERGIKLEAGVLKKLSKELEGELGTLEKKIYKLAGTSFNISSPSQLSDILFKRMAISIKGLRKTPGGVISTQASELAKLAHTYPIVNLIMEYRELSKLKTTYVDAFPKLVDVSTGRLHTRFLQTGTATGRLSSEEPNLQNIPVRSEWANKIRKAFVAEKGFSLVSFDYSQIELRLAAAISNDEKMIRAFKEGKDIHALTASFINKVPIEKVTQEMRRQAKTLNFGVLYGMGANAFAQTSGVSRDAAKQFIEEYFKDFSGIARYVEEIKDEARRTGFVRTITGRRRYIPEIHAHHQMVRSQAERIAVNMPIQGSDADINKLAMIAIDKQYGGDADVRMLIQIHDALLFEIKNEKIKEVAPRIKALMEGVVSLSVPLKIDVKAGDTWADLQEQLL